MSVILIRCWWNIKILFVEPGKIYLWQYISWWAVTKQQHRTLKLAQAAGAGAVGMLA